MRMRFELQIPAVGLRWTIGDVSDAGYEALGLSIRSAWNLFGDRAQYAVCVNTVPLSLAAARTGGLPVGVRWLQTSDSAPEWLLPYVGSEMAEGVAWKLSPVRVFPALHEIALDNDVILWALPTAMRDWLCSREDSACLMAADLQPALGRFSAICNDRALNSGIRGFPPGFDMKGRLQKRLAQSGVMLQSELDEQGLQAAVLLESNLFVVSTEDVSICSPFPNHQRRLGRCGVHFVGLNPKRSPWTLDGRGAHEVIREHWDRYASELAVLVDSN